MKIFNWVHRRFNNKLAENEVRKNGLIAEDEQLQLVVENNTSVFERWRGGILTIGTFGYDPLKDENEENDVCFHDQEESDKEHLLSEEYESDLITADSDEEEEEEVEFNEEGEEEEEEEEESSNSLVYAAAYAHEFERLMEGKKTVVNESESEFDFEFDYVMLEKTTEKVRTTLADLFSADTEELQKKKQQQQEKPINKLGETAKEKANNYCKQQGFSFGKKLIADEARPIHKLHQLMRRMLKRKIHPDEHASLLP